MKRNCDSKVSSKSHAKSQLDDYSNQQNPNSFAHKSLLDNRSNQMNPNHARSKKGQ